MQIVLDFACVLDATCRYYWRENKSFPYHLSVRTWASVLFLVLTTVLDLARFGDFRHGGYPMRVTDHCEEYESASGTDTEHGHAVPFLTALFWIIVSGAGACWLAYFGWRVGEWWTH